ncbi:MAG: glycosyltransferase family 39 protein [Candidatus Omnitrophica bacterium]|nr:glycosyltransferase family 39 protein [Candidatus Omnitrophota bacterium]
MRRIFKSVLCAIILFAILGFAFQMRATTFWLPHWQGDQSHYISLAMKLEKLGFSYFNLRGINVGKIMLGKDNEVKIVYPVLNKDITSTGEILEGLHAVGIHYYDQPFFHKPPGFPYVLLFSHKLFAIDNLPYTVIASDIGRFLLRSRPVSLLKVQFWATLVPLAFGLGTILCTFLLGKTLFSYRTGLYASFMMAIHPVAIMTSQKIWADDMVAFFVILSVLTFILAIKRKSGWISLAAGISCGVAVLAKQTGGYLLIAVGIFSVLAYVSGISDTKSLLVTIFNKYFIMFSIGVFLVSGFWFIKIYMIYGDPLWQPTATQSDLSSVDVTGWFKVLRSRPPGWILYPIGIFYLCPLFIPAYCSLRDFISETWKLVKKKSYDYRFILLWVVILVFYFMLKGGHEHRRMLPVYPALAVLSGFYLDKFRMYSGKFSRYTGNRFVREFIILTLFTLCTLWSAPIGITASLTNKLLIQIPF